MTQPFTYQQYSQQCQFVEEQEQDNLPSSLPNIPSRQLSVLNTHSNQTTPIHINQSDRYYIQPPRQIPKRSYSLQADMITGWKPKKNLKINLNNVFPINFSQTLVDELVYQLTKSKNKSNKYSIVYLGPRPSNSYILHENQKYANPYPIDKKVDSKVSDRPHLYFGYKPNECKFKFNSDFETGNLDVAVEVSPLQYDLFIRVDSNTHGHNNWFNFTIQNKQFIGSIRFNICNFRRQISLYQRGLRPYSYSQKAGTEWKQVGKDIKYQHKRLRYSFLYQNQEENEQLCKYFNLSFTYDFEFVMDKVQFAYCIPYTFSQLNKFLTKLQHSHHTQLCKSLSGLPIHLLSITDNSVYPQNKKVVLITSRVHPGQSNSSYIVEGFLQFLCGEDSIAYQLRRIYHFYVIPMLNPDGVVAGNYRTSLFGRDLNRTFQQSRKYAFPQTFYLNEYVKELKKMHKQRLCFYLDFHGHSVKKNVFMYGPDFPINHQYYNSSRQLPKILANLTPIFRYYSCSFKISTEKSTTARATFNRSYKIPFTYTMQASNGTYYDSSIHRQVEFTIHKWKQMGYHVAIALNNLHLHPKSNIKKINYQKTLYESQTEQKEQSNNSDDQIEEGGSDSEPEDEDLPMEQLQYLQKIIEGDSNKRLQQQKTFKKHINNRIRMKAQQIKHSFQIQIKQTDLVQTKPKMKFSRNQMQASLPPIITQNRISFFASRKKKSINNQKLKHLSILDISKQEQTSTSKAYNMLRVNKLKPDIINVDQLQTLLNKKYDKLQMLKKTLRSNR